MRIFRKFFKVKSKAFTLIELLISISIIAVMAAMSISAYPQFSQQLQVSSELYKILAFTKETQSYGVSAYTTPGVKVVYGFQITKNSSVVQRVLKTAPTDITNQYYVSNVTNDVADNNSSSPQLQINPKFQISKICSDDTCATTYDQAYVFFRRPNPDARIVGLVGSVINPDVNTGSLPKLEIFLQSNNNSGIFKKMIILQTGQMYVADW